jgi:hypothetical protein
VHRTDETLSPKVGQRTGLARSLYSFNLSIGDGPKGSSAPFLGILNE